LSLIGFDATRERLSYVIEELAHFTVHFVELLAWKLQAVRADFEISAFCAVSYFAFFASPAPLARELGCAFEVEGTPATV